MPALIAILPDMGEKGANDSLSMTRRFATVVERFGGLVFAVTGLLILLVALGLSRLQVENRFIDYFKDTTEIYQGMELLDSRLGGTIPLDIILYPPSESTQTVDVLASADLALADERKTIEVVASNDLGFEDDFGDDEDGLWDDDAFGEDVSFADENSAEIGYWFTLEGRDLIDQIHGIVEARSESGKVLSLST